MDTFFDKSILRPDEYVGTRGVRRSDLDLLHSGHAVPCDVNSAWIHCFNLRIVDPSAPSSAVLPAHFYQSLTWGTLRPNVYSYDKVRNYTKRFGDVFALDRLFVFLLVPLGSQSDGHRAAFAMVDFKERSLSYYDAFGGFQKQRVTFATEILTLLRRWLSDEHLCKRGTRMNESDWTIVPLPKDLPRLSQCNYISDGVFAIKGMHCLALGEPLAFTDDLLQPLRRCILFEVLTESMANNDNAVKRRHRANVLTFVCVAKLCILAARTRERAWRPCSAHVAALGSHFALCQQSRKC